MSDINPINNSVPAAPPAGSHTPELQAVREAQVAAQVKADATKQAKQQAQSAADNKESISMPSYTVHYQVQGKHISVSILDQEGRLVKTVPSNEMLKALRQANLSPRVNFHG